MGKKQIRFETNFDKSLQKEILSLLYRDFINCKEGEFNKARITFHKLAKKLNIDLTKKEEWIKLRLHLWQLDEEGFIEERHFLEGLDGMVDYAIENKGIQKMLKRKVRNAVC